MYTYCNKKNICRTVVLLDLYRHQSIARSYASLSLAVSWCTILLLKKTDINNRAWSVYTFFWAHSVFKFSPIFFFLISGINVYVIYIKLNFTKEKNMHNRVFSPPIFFFKTVMQQTYYFSQKMTSIF